MNKFFYFLVLLVGYKLTCFGTAETSTGTLKEESIPGGKSLNLPHLCENPKTIPLVDITIGYDVNPMEKYSGFVCNTIKTKLLSDLQGVKQKFPYTRLGLYESGVYEYPNTFWFSFKNLTENLNKGWYPGSYICTIVDENPKGFVSNGIWMSAIKSQFFEDYGPDKSSKIEISHHNFIVVFTEHEFENPTNNICNNNYSYYTNSTNQNSWTEDCGPTFKQLAENLNYYGVEVIFVPVKEKVDYYRSIVQNLKRSGYKKSGIVIEGNEENQDLITSKIIEIVTSRVCEVKRETGAGITKEVKSQDPEEKPGVHTKEVKSQDPEEKPGVDTKEVKSKDPEEKPGVDTKEVLLHESTVRKERQSHSNNLFWIAVAFLSLIILLSIAYVVYFKSKNSPKGGNAVQNSFNSI